MTCLLIDYTSATFDEMPYITRQSLAHSTLIQLNTHHRTKLKKRIM